MSSCCDPRYEEHIRILNELRLRESTQSERESPDGSRQDLRASDSDGVLSDGERLPEDRTLGEIDSSL